MVAGGIPVIIQHSMDRKAEPVEAEDFHTLMRMMAVQLEAMEAQLRATNPIQRLSDIPGKSSCRCVLLREERTQVLLTS
jgi:hypothetical protein